MTEIKTGMSPHKLVILKRVTEDLKNLSQEEFLAELEKHKDGEIAQLLRHAWTELPAPPENKIAEDK